MPKEYRLPKEFANIWLEALRSGKYLQTGGALRKLILEGWAYCCIGLACYIAYPKGRKWKSEDIPRHDIPVPGLPMELIQEKDQDNLKPLLQMLVDMNDIQKKPFTEIADWIEENVEFY